MNNITPFFPAWRPQMAALGRRTRQHRSAAEIENEFARFLPASLLNKAHRGVGSRNRIFTRARTFWLFVWQVLQPQTPCRAVTRKMQAEGERERHLIDASSSAYCQARARLPLSLLSEALAHSERSARRSVKGGVPGWDRPVRVVDATSFQMPDTPANRKAYHYPTGQKKGCGFPVLRALALFSLESGAITRITTAPCYTGELTMLKPLWPTLKEGDILLGDRIYGAFTPLAGLPMQGVDVVARLHQGRNLDLRRALKLGSDDWLTSLPKPVQRPVYLSKKEWEKLPSKIMVRVLRLRIQVKGFRTRTVWLVTTLLDPLRYTREKLGELYLRRWQMELCFRDLKTTMAWRCYAVERLR